jgi:hypothetical protein
MSGVRRAVLAAAVGCGLTVTGAGRADDKPPAPDDAPVKAVVAHFAKNEVKLRKDESGWWVVAEPKGDGYEVIIALRAFPATATEQAMRDELKQINLAFMLNAPARVAMSHPGLRATDPARKPPRLDQVPVVAKLEKLFQEYRPTDPKP